MNARQAAKAAAKRIEELEYFNSKSCEDIIHYNQCIEHMIRRGSPCDYCEDLEECKAEGKDVQIGCEEWILRFDWSDDNERVSD